MSRSRTCGGILFCSVFPIFTRNFSGEYECCAVARGVDEARNAIISDNKGMDAYSYGWVEIFDAENLMWDGIIKASHLMYPDDYVLRVLFGMSNNLFGVRSQPAKSEIVSIAERRGLPEDVCSEIINELQHPKMSTFTWITWQELKVIDWGEPTPNPSWLVLFKMMAVLAEEYGEEYVRLTVGFRFSPEQ